MGLVFVIDFNGYFGLYLNWQFHTLSFVMLVIPFTVSFVIISISFAMLIMKTRGASRKWTPVVIISGVLFCLQVCGLEIGNALNYAFYQFRTDISLATGITACILYGIGINFSFRETLAFQFSSHHS